MRYFVYLSAAKVDMLYPQVPFPARGPSWEITVDLKVVKATQRSEERTELTVYDKLAAVEGWIYAREPVSRNEPQPAVIFVGCGPSGRGAVCGTITFYAGEHVQGSDMPSR